VREGFQRVREILQRMRETFWRVRKGLHRTRNGFSSLRDEGLHAFNEPWRGRWRLQPLASRVWRVPAGF
jgi:hypothetical protein